MIPPRPPQRIGRHRPLADINVTPLVDVMLVLLVVFMITAPMIASGLRVDLPRAGSARPVEPQPPVVITIEADGRLTLGGEAIAPGDLVGAIEARLGGDRTPVLQLRADRAVDYGTIVEVMDLLVTNGLNRIAFLADRSSPGREPSTSARTVDRTAAAGAGP